MGGIKDTNAWVPVAIVLFLVTTGFAGAVETSSPTGETVIFGEERWEDVDRTINERVVIPSGATLVVRDSTLDVNVSEECTIVRLNGMYCYPDIQILAGGQLVIENSEITTSSDEFLRYPTISADGGSLEIRNSSLSKTGEIKAQATGANLTFIGNEVTDAINAVGVWRGADGLIEANHFHDTNAGVFVRDASPVIQDNNFTDAVTDWVIRIQSSIVGEKAFEAAPLVENNTVIGGGTGIFSDSGFGVEIVDNTFVEQEFKAISHRIPGIGSKVQSTPPTITGNVFEEQHKVLDVRTVDSEEVEPPVELEFHGNSIDAWCSYISASSGENAPLTVDATSNWWGSADGPLEPEDENCIAFVEDDAEIIVEPWLESPPGNTS